MGLERKGIGNPRVRMFLSLLKRATGPLVLNRRHIALEIHFSAEDIFHAFRLPQF